MLYNFKDWRDRLDFRWTSQGSGVLGDLTPECRKMSHLLIAHHHQILLYLWVTSRSSPALHTPIPQSALFHLTCRSFSIILPSWKGYQALCHTHLRANNGSFWLKKTLKLEGDVGRGTFQHGNAIWGLMWPRRTDLLLYLLKVEDRVGSGGPCQSGFVPGRSRSNYTRWVTARGEKRLERQRGDCYSGTIKTKKHTHTLTIDHS